MATIKTEKAALKEAVRRWGKTAATRKYHKSGRCVVGVIMFGMFFEVRGDGSSWDEAFTKAGERFPAQKMVNP